MKIVPTIIMLEHLHTLICLRPIIDAETRRSTYVDILENVTVQKSKEGIILPRFVLISKFWNVDGTHIDTTLELKISHRGPKDKRNKKITIFNIPIKKDGDILLAQMAINHLLINSAGR